MRKLIIEIAETEGKHEYILRTEENGGVTTFTTTQKIIGKDVFSYFEVIGMIENLKHILISSNK